MRRFLCSRNVWVFCLAGFAFATLNYFQAASATFRPKQLFLEEMTWPEVHAALEAGYRTVIIPTGGTEQNGPHAVLGKHNFVVAHTSAQIAERLGGTLIAPVIAYVPEGDFGASPTGHMQWPGTISLPGPIFEQLLEATIRSFALHGFDEILLIGDSGGNQAAQSRVAAAMNLEFAPSGIAVQHISDYYDNNGQIAYLESLGFDKEQIGTHAGLRDTSELFFVKPDEANRIPLPIPSGWNSGFNGRPDLATSEIGEALILLKIEVALTQIHRLRDAGQ
ncbi:creatininase family protein [Rhodobacteraceae bacterium B1Z28]|uniref:Creatininase family protein n=1 Tax=Ruegeria haliotis TaxID=2747601 RepID=A0ABX2PLD3_9RHOB|nr:creatininase family protein [Ruegeria haliotis]NVO54843.1 creatininase family protein [Ruegeria haliotis]